MAANGSATTVARTAYTGPQPTTTVEAAVPVPCWSRVTGLLAKVCVLPAPPITLDAGRRSWLLRSAVPSHSPTATKCERGCQDLCRRMGGWSGLARSKTLWLLLASLIDPVTPYFSWIFEGLACLAKTLFEGFSARPASWQACQTCWRRLASILSA
jgi:hypothetical protein